MEQTFILDKSWAKNLTWIKSWPNLNKQFCYWFHTFFIVNNWRKFRYFFVLLLIENEWIYHNREMKTSCLAIRICDTNSDTARETACVTASDIASDTPKWHCKWHCKWHSKWHCKCDTASDTALTHDGTTSQWQQKYWEKCGQSFAKIRKIETPWTNIGFRQILDRYWTKTVLWIFVKNISKLCPNTHSTGASK